MLVNVVCCLQFLFYGYFSFGLGCENDAKNQHNVYDLIISTAMLHEISLPYLWFVISG